MTWAGGIARAGQAEATLAAGHRGRRTGGAGRPGHQRSGRAAYLDSPLAGLSQEVVQAAQHALVVLPRAQQGGVGRRHAVRPALGSAAGRASRFVRAAGEGAPPSAAHRQRPASQPCAQSTKGGAHQARTTVRPASAALSSTWRTSCGPVTPEGNTLPVRRGAPAAASITSHLAGRGEWRRSRVGCRELQSYWPSCSPAALGPVP